MSAQKQNKHNSRKVGRGNSVSWINSGGPRRCALRKARNIAKRLALHTRALTRVNELPDWQRTARRTATRMAAAENIYPLR